MNRPHSKSGKINTYIYRKVFIAALLVLAMLFPAVPPARAAAASADEAVLPPPVIAKDYDPQASRLVVQTGKGADLEALAENSGGEVVRTGPLHYCTLQFEIPPNTGEMPEKKIEDLKYGIRAKVLSLPGVLNAEWSTTYTLSGEQTIQAAVSDPEYSLQWALKKIRADQVWEEGVTGEGVIVAVVDTGVDLDHPDLAGSNQVRSNLVQGYNAYTRSALPGAEQDDHGHGTSVAGVIAALNNDLGIVGIAYNAKIMPIKAMDKTGEGEDSIIADGIIWAADHGARIINMSIGSPEQTKVLDDALEYAAKKGCLLVAASGNNKDQVVQSAFQPQTTTNQVAYPGAHPRVMAVSAVDMNDSIADFSLTGPEVILSAPGKRILTDFWSEKEVGCGYSTGTSIAAPFITGAAALLWSKYPKLKAEDIQQALLGSASDLGAKGRDKDYGFGRVDVYRALKTLEEQRTYSSPATLSWEGGNVYAGSTAGEPGAVLTVPAGTFPLGVNSNGLDNTMTISLSTVNSPGEFPEEITPASEAFALNPWGENPVEKALTLKVRLTEPKEQLAAPNPAALSGQDRIAYLYKWSNSRWIRVGGGASQTAKSIRVSVYEPGIYRAGWSLEPDFDRISGKDRIHTAIEIARQAFPTGADTVIIARADSFPDALAGAPLAYKYQAPILLTFPEQISAEAYQLIQDLAPRRIYILGGSGAVSAAVEKQLHKLAYVTRIAGPNRYSTAAAVADLLGTRGQAVVVNGLNFPDAIAAASHAALQGKPILLTPSQSLGQETEDALRKLSVTDTEVIGGAGVIANNVLTQLQCPDRLSGSDRYATSAEVIRANKPDGRIIYLATGMNFPDALTGGILAAANSSNILLIPSAGPTRAQRAVLETLSDKKVIALGGEGAVTPEGLKTVQALVR